MFDTVELTVAFIVHSQCIQLRLRAGLQQTSFTLAPQVVSIPEKSLSKIERWCVEHLDSYAVYRVLQELHQCNVQDEVQRAKALMSALPEAQACKPQPTVPSYAVCDYSTQGQLAVWGSVIVHEEQIIRCCGLVPAGKQGEQYAIERTHEYLKALDIQATIYSDEEGSVKKLRAQIPVQYMSRSNLQHCPAHQLAHHFALLLAGKEGGDTLTALGPLLRQVWVQTPAEYICLKDKWRVSVLK